MKTKNLPRWNSGLIYLTKGWPLVHQALQTMLVYRTATLPHFENEQAINWFESRLADANCYLEFGSGGSTFLAAKRGLPFVSKESDLLFSLSVRQTVEQAGYQDANQHYIHADIGFTGDWGYPSKGRDLSKNQIKRFAQYSDLPQGVRPDFILIDGRFRVACALKCIQALGDETEWTMVVDDYIDRPEYYVIEQFAQLQEMVGRMAVFQKCAAVPADALAQVLSEYLFDCR